MRDYTRICLRFLLIISLLGLFALCLWLILLPKDPRFTIMEVSMVNNASSAGGGSIYFVLEIRNPNQDSSVYYDNILLTLYHGQDIVGSNTISGFHQRYTFSGFRQRYHITKPVLERVDANPKVWEALQKDVMNSTAKLKAVLLGRIRYKTWGIKSRHHGIRLQAIIPIGSDGKISGKKKAIRLRPGSK